MIYRQLNEFTVNYLMIVSFKHLAQVCNWRGVLFGTRCLMIAAPIILRLLYPHTIDHGDTANTGQLHNQVNTMRRLQPLSKIPWASICVLRANILFISMQIYSQGWDALRLQTVGRVVNQGL